MDRGEKYVDRHWFDVNTAAGERMRIYCERRIRTRQTLVAVLDR